MKRLIKTGILLGVFALCLVAFGKVNAYADMMLTEYEESKVQYIDLDGDGKKESVRLESLPQNRNYWDQAEKFIVYVNDKKIYEYDNPEGFGLAYGFVDINPSDKSKQIVVMNSFEDADYEYYVINYKNGKGSLWFKTYYDIMSTQKKNNKVMCTSWVSCRIGEPHVVIECKIKNKELVPVKTTVLKVADNWAGTEKWYTASTKIKVYAKASKKNVVKTLKSGDKFRITKVKGKYTAEGSFNVTYAYIDTVDGDGIGWINVKGTGWENGQIVSDPLYYS